MSDRGEASPDLPPVARTGFVHDAHPADTTMEEVDNDAEAELLEAVDAAKGTSRGGWMAGSVPSYTRTVRPFTLTRYRLAAGSRRCCTL